MQEEQITISRNEGAIGIGKYKDGVGVIRSYIVVEAQNEIKKYPITDNAYQEMKDDFEDLSK